MLKNDIYNDIAKRTGGDIYIGVVGPVRSGKSTFISKIMNNLVIPNISNKFQKQIALDEMPQSSNGKQIMTTQPMFVPANSVKVSFNKATANIRLVDCVGYYVNGATGNLDGDNPRMVKTPWSDEEIPFDKAGEIGTKKVITDYSTIGIVITTDGSFTGIERSEYEKAEEKVIIELKSINKPFIIILNTTDDKSENSLKLASALESKYDTQVICKNIENLEIDDITNIFEKTLLEFPMEDVNIELPDWLNVLDKDNNYIDEIIKTVKTKSENVHKMKDYYYLNECFFDSESFEPMELLNLNLSNGNADYKVKAKDDLFLKIVSDISGEDIDNSCKLLTYLKDCSVAKKQFTVIKDALSSAKEDGYGIVLPLTDELIIEKPELTRQGNKYGVKVKAVAPSLHIMKVDVKTEVSPLVGENKQGEDMANYIIEKFNDNPENVLKTEMFGRTLNDLIEEGLNSKLTQIPKNVQNKFQKTMCKVVNENKGGLICIIL